MLESIGLDNLKSEICSDCILMLFDRKYVLYVLSTNASSVDLGAVLSYRLLDNSEQPIVFLSSSLTSTQRK